MLDFPGSSTYLSTTAGDSPTLSNKVPCWITGLPAATTEPEPELQILTETRARVPRCKRCPHSLTTESPMAAKHLALKI